MSQVIIEMEMPKSCRECPLQDTNLMGFSCILVSGTVFSYEKRNANCPLHELPPHGRLIDADAFISSTKDAYGEKELTGQRGTLHVPLGGVFKEYIDEAPTILEANR